MRNQCHLAGCNALSGFVEKIETGRIHPSNDPLRRQLGRVDDLMASIMEKGLLDPIVARPRDGGYEVVAGNRRLEACKKLRFSKIPCHVVELDDREAYEVSLTENLQRETLNPIEEGQAYKKYVDEHGYGGISELAKVVGKSPTYVSRRIALLGLPEAIKEEVLRGRKSPSLANELLPLDQEEREEVTEIITERNITSRSEVRFLIKHGRAGRTHGNRTPKSSYYQQQELTVHIIDRTLAKCIASIKDNMSRFDGAMTALGNDKRSWIVSETLLWERRAMNEQVDELLRLKKKFRSNFFKNGSP